MYIRLDGQFMDLSTAEYFGAAEACPPQDRFPHWEDLFRLADGRWLLHKRYTATAQAATVDFLEHDQAVDWLIALRQAQENEQPLQTLKPRRSVPQEVVPYDDHAARMLGGSSQICAPPPLGNIY